MRAIPLLLLAQLCVSSAPVLITLCDLPPATVAAGRLLGASLFFLPFALPRIRRELAGVARADIVRVCIGGALFGIHFVLFIGAFKLTSFESAVVVLSFQPMTALLLGQWMLGERSNGGMWLAVLAAFIGLAMLVWNDATVDDGASNLDRVLGDLCVIGACVLIVISYIFGRRLRQKLSFPVYIVIFFACGGFASVICAILMGERPATNDAEPWLWLLALIFLPTITGHALFHYLVKHVRVFSINIVFVLEPLMAVSAKWLIDDPERFGPAELGGIQIAGAVLLLAGVTVGLAARERGLKKP
ncbi:MAG: EamA family transporter [Planctomycetes bacterium]|nr:EamA family transporter [Planctomycetota bacterium]NUQ35232.1 EamA family transporter [Planctomycetaceae bacterium]